MKIYELLNALINVAEKGANIARIIRSEAALLELLVQEKKGPQKNERFVQDFKTLADVLVQEVVKYDLSQQFAGIGAYIQGEESNKFTNTLGDSVTIQIQASPDETKKLLSSVLDGNDQAAKILADVVHRDVNVSDTYDHGTLEQTLTVDDIGVWIDPIDSTAQYIQGGAGQVDGGLASEGLQCVVVLIGAYYRSTGLPIIGVTNQPFFTQGENGIWQGKTTWGVCVDDVKLNSLQHQQQHQHQQQDSSPDISNNHQSVILVSSSECTNVTDVLSQNFLLRDITGAGYKLLGVCHGFADAYCLTKSSNYKWDCCGPHAILLSLGGGIVKFSDLLQAAKQSSGGCCDVSQLSQISYNKPDDSTQTGVSLWCNHGGIVAYKSTDVLKKIAQSVVNIQVDE